MADKPKLIIRAGERGPEYSFSHPLNPQSELHGWALAGAGGLKRLGVNLIRVPAGKESFVYHLHYGEEEWCYVLSGRALVDLDDETHELGPGDFVAFPTGVAHHLRNPFGEDFVYLSGGETHPREIADFPRHDKRLVRDGDRVALYPISTAETFTGEKKL